ncbi:hypothetical protein QCA50_004675 [Cerrena zonata]|uniref:Ribosomal protein S14 n=1 Tax=Cerrena zonata TaxID=2478898 RepID=A0AAW0GFC0_9APHY
MSENPSSKEKSTCITQSYYARNTKARQEYQIQYNQVRRATRRKLGKAALEILRKQKRDEIEGNLP